MNSLPFGGMRDRVRTLVAQDDAVWIWPGIPLTLRRGQEIVPAPIEVIRFWITRLHGPEALYRELSSAISKAALCLAVGDEVKAQQVLDRLNLATLSRDGAALVKTLSTEFGISFLEMPTHAGARTWDQKDLALYLPIFEAQLRCLQKAGDFDEGKHPRWPKGTPDSKGGRFAPKEGSGGYSISTEPPPGIGHNSEKFPEDLPEIPPEKPLGAYRLFIKPIARWMVAALVSRRLAAIVALIEILRNTDWTAKYIDELKANLDEPKTLDELYKNPGGPGYDEHHIAEKASAKEDGFLEVDIEARENKVFIPAIKHREITAWYQKKNPDYGGLSPRQYLRGKTWEERRKLGIQKLIDFGVLKP